MAVLTRFRRRLGSDPSDLHLNLAEELPDQVCNRGPHFPFAWNAVSESLNRVMPDLVAVYSVLVVAPSGLARKLDEKVLLGLSECCACKWDASAERKQSVMLSCLSDERPSSRGGRVRR